MNRVIQHSEMHHLADDTNLLYSSNSMKKIKRYINHDLKLTVHWFRANRISLNADKTEIIIFRPQGKDITKKLNFRISGQQMYISKQVKYLGLMLDESLTLLSHISMLKDKLRRANDVLAKLRHYTSSKLLTTVYNALFKSQMRYGYQIWGQTRNQNISDVVKLQKKAVRIINFSDKHTLTKPLFSKLKIQT